MNPEEIAVEELKLLQSIVDRHEKLIFQMRGWLYALITALSSIVLTVGRNAFSLYLCIGLGVTIVFLLTELFQRIPVYRAIVRIREVEGLLKDKREYVGPKISETLSPFPDNPRLSMKKDFRDAFLETRSLRIWLPYVLLFLLVLIIYLIN